MVQRVLLPGAREGVGDEILASATGEPSGGAGRERPYCTVAVEWQIYRTSTADKLCDWGY